MTPSTRKTPTIVEQMTSVMEDRMYRLCDNVREHISRSGY